MIENLSGPTGQLLKLAADAALLRHEVIANNIANVNTPGYQAKRVSFEHHLNQFISPDGQINGAELSSQADSLKAMLQGGDAVTTTGEQVELDKEMIQLTQNVLRYHALLDVISKRGSIVTMAIKEGR